MRSFPFQVPTRKSPLHEHPDPLKQLKQGICQREPETVFTREVPPFETIISWFEDRSRSPPFQVNGAVLQPQAWNPFPINFTDKDGFENPGCEASLVDRFLGGYFVLGGGGRLVIPLALC